MMRSAARGHIAERRRRRQRPLIIIIPAARTWPGLGTGASAIERAPAGSARLNASTRTTFCVVITACGGCDCCEARLLPGSKLIGEKGCREGAEGVPLAASACKQGIRPPDRRAAARGGHVQALAPHRPLLALADKLPLGVLCLFLPAHCSWFSHHHAHTAAKLTGMRALVDRATDCRSTTPMSQRS